MPTTKQSPPRHHHPPWHHLLLPLQCQSLPTEPFPRVPRVVLLAPALSPAPTSPACPPPPSEHLQAGCPAPGPWQTPDLVCARNAPPPQPSFATALVLTTAWAAWRPDICHGRISPWTSAWIPEHGSRSQSPLKRDCLEGGSGGVGKATKGHGHPGCGNAPATLPTPLPHPTTGCHNSGSCSGQPQPNGRLARMSDEVGWLHRQPRVAKMPQQGYGQGAAGMP